LVGSPGNAKSQSGSEDNNQPRINAKHANHIVVLDSCLFAKFAANSFCLRNLRLAWFG
jgi:hypothetical protein